MKGIRLIGLGVLAVLALTVTAASASAHEFIASKAGAKLEGKALSTQVFTTAAGKVECKALNVTAGETALKSETQKLTIQYKECKAFGLSAEITPAEYVFNANGTVNIQKAITIKAAGCTVTVPAQEKLGTITYKNSSPVKTITLEPSVTGIKSKGEGFACTYAEEAKGTYAGNSEIAAAGDTQEWF